MPVDELNQCPPSRYSFHVTSAPNRRSVSFSVLPFSIKTSGSSTQWSRSIGVSFSTSASSQVDRPAPAFSASRPAIAREMAFYKRSRQRPPVPALGGDGVVCALSSPRPG